MASMDDIPTRGIVTPAAGSPLPFTEDVFERFYRGTLPTVWALARRVCRDDEEAADVAQEAYLAVYRVWSAGALRTEPEHLLLRVAKRRAIDALRARVRRQRLQRFAPRAAAPELSVGGPLDVALASLNPRESSLLLLQAVGGYTYDELARIDGVTIGAVKSRLYRARRELADRYRREGGSL